MSGGAEKGLFHGLNSGMTLQHIVVIVAVAQDAFTAVEVEQ